MLEPMLGAAEFTENDLEFVVGEVAPDAKNKAQLKHLVSMDPDFRKAMVGDDRVFQRVIGDEEVFLQISPVLYFEILLRKSHKEIEAATHTVERLGRESIPVFDTPEVVQTLLCPGVISYLAQMLASFTRIQSTVISVRIRKGIRRRVRYDDMDIDSLRHMCTTADEEHRFGFYKRIADVCLFISTIFREHVLSGYGYPASRRALSLRRSLDDYEQEGRRYYGLAEEHPAAGAMDLSEVFGLLRDHFIAAQKPLSFIATHYLHSRQNRIFGAPGG